MAKLENIEIPGFNPNATSYKDCIKNTRAIEKVRSELVWDRTFWSGEANMLGEQGKGAQANRAKDNLANTQKKINKLTTHLRNWEKKATQTPEGKAKEQNHFAKEQKKAKEDKVRRQMINAIFPKR